MLIKSLHTAFVAGFALSVVNMTTILLSGDKSTNYTMISSVVGTLMLGALVYVLNARDGDIFDYVSNIALLGIFSWLVALIVYRDNDLLPSTDVAVEFVMAATVGATLLVLYIMHTIWAKSRDNVRDSSSEELRVHQPVD